mgnify:CR=1 FL=1
MRLFGRTRGLMNNWTLQTKVTALVSASLVLTVAAIGAGLYASMRQETRLQELITTSAALRNHMTADMMHDALRSDVLAAQLAGDAKERGEARANLRDHEAEFTRAMDANERLALPPAIQKQLEESRRQLEQYITRARAVAAEDDSAAAKVRMPQFNEQFEALEKANEQLSDSIQRSAGRARDAAVEELTSCRRTLSGALLLVLGFGGWVIFLVNRLIGSLRTQLAKLEQGSHRAAVAAGEVHEGSRSVLDAAHEQENSLRETARVTAETREAADSNAGAGRRAADFMQRSHEDILEANRRLEEMVAAISEIEASSGEISKIIRVIEDIAFQTNILALNAAVEAARAGEAGAGFAVVADEVRRLAHRCADAAQQTTGLIRRSLEKSREGRERVDSAVGAIAAVTAGATQVKTLVEELNARTDGQARDLARLAMVIGSMEEANRKTALVMNGTASKAERLGNEAGGLSSASADLTRFTTSC